MSEASTQQADDFRSELRAFLERAAPKSLIGRPIPMMEGDEESGEIRADRKRWLDAMAERGLTVPTWPKEYGGAGLSPKQAKVLQEELGRMRMAPPLMGMGVTM